MADNVMAAPVETVGTPLAATTQPRRSVPFLVIQAILLAQIAFGLCFLVSFCADGVSRSADASQAAMTAARNLAGASVPPFATDDLYITTLSAPGQTADETSTRISILTSLSGVYGDQMANYTSGFIASLVALVSAIGLMFNRIGIAMRTSRGISG